MMEWEFGVYEGRGAAGPRRTICLTICSRFLEPYVLPPLDELMHG